MKKMLLLAAAAAFAMSATAAGPGASSAGTGAKAGAKPAHVSPDAVLYDQNTDDNGIGIVSQNFESTFDAYDAQGADDFTVPSGFKWKVSEVDVTGVYFNGSGPATSVHVTIYKSKNGAPGESAIVSDQDGITGNFSSGSFAITLPTKVTLKPGKYWVSVQANMDFGVGGEWGWETSNTLKKVADMWKNPGDGFATGCTSYTDLLTCIPSGEGPSYMFALKGKAIPL